MLEAITAIAEDGLVILENAVELAHVDALNEQMVKDTMDLVNRATTHFNSAGNISQVPPIRPETMFEDIFANQFAGPILEGMLGPRPVLWYLNGNTALKSESRQDVHADLAWRHMHHTFGLVVNIMLVEATKENGTTEVWLGTHRNTTIADHVSEDSGAIKPDLLEARRAVRPPIQARIPKGSLIIRDLRLWHAGMPNHTDIPRCMVAMVHSPAWLGNKIRLKLPENVRPMIESFKSPIRYSAEYVDPKGFDHLSLEFNYDPSPGGGLPKDERAEWARQWKQKWGSRF